MDVKVAVVAVAVEAVVVEEALLFCLCLLTFLCPLPLWRGLVRNCGTSVVGGRIPFGGRMLLNIRGRCFMVDGGSSRQFVESEQCQKF